MSKNDGGSAFPLHDLSGYGMGPADNMTGISARDWFAGQALPTIIQALHDAAKMGKPSLGQGPCTIAAQSAYEYADAMLAERDKP